MKDMVTQLRMFEEHQSVCVHSHCFERERIEKKFAPLIREELQLGQIVSYVGNKDVPILRLYRYKEAFAFRFVQEFIRRFQLNTNDYLFDPFCGMGTTLFAAMQHRIPAMGIDRLPIATFVARTLPLFLSVEPRALQSTFEELRSRVHSIEPARIAADVAIMQKAFSDDTLLALRRWKSAIDSLPFPLRDVFLLLFFAILEPCSYTAKDGQFLRLKRDKPVADPEEMLQRKVYEAEKDIQAIQAMRWAEDALQFLPSVQLGDARDLKNVSFARPPTAVITSPPYANRYDYTRTYSLELCFHFVKSFEELKALRFSVLRSHIESKVHVQERPPHPVIEEVVYSLRERSKALNNPKIPDMLTAYFVDMQRVIHEWARVLAPRAHVAMVVDNVRFEGELVPVDLVLSEMAEEVGFVVQQIIVARYKGNSSQQMGKFGRVPVRESILIWQKEE
uniref:site-specific DNA-methyltransferase (cytosine-N(4)-specific) n=2 Tax=Candidatus Bipolaricaulota TaxID=67810 RepID=H5SFC3_9BACT|nr:N(4)- cytosine-specific methyltransferase BsoBI [uncultured Acetothermia bacterium]BAL57947.1 N(4)- cytosine-specific methyltransferase BsoBI [uncultured Acetothermia bacterium]BAL58561.1 N(4)- cytosine-specific methyltransferase BsoBI [Candidatus Acetothermum autotrophicum]